MQVKMINESNKEISYLFKIPHINISCRASFLRLFDLAFYRPLIGQRLIDKILAKA